MPRLIDLGIESFLLKSTLRAVVAQRLVRVLCDRCKVPHRLTEADILSLIPPRPCAKTPHAASSRNSPAAMVRAGPRMARQ